MTERDHAAYTVQHCHLAVSDAALFLDSHPRDNGALRYFERMNQSYAQAVQTYEKHFGPLTVSASGGSPDNWSWISGPWPWEGAK